MPDVAVKSGLSSYISDFPRKEGTQAFTATFFLFSSKSLIDVSRVVALNTGLCCSHRGANFSEFGPMEMKKMFLIFRNQILLPKCRNQI